MICGPARTAGILRSWERKKQIPRGNDRKKGRSKGRSRSLRDDSQKGKGKGKGEGNGNDNGNDNGNNEYRGPSLRSRMTRFWAG
jgi:hypothetical protein